MIGAGGIVRDAHLPTYRALGLEVAGLFDTRMDAARAIANEFSIQTIFPSLDAATMRENVVYNLAVPGDQILGILASLPVVARCSFRNRWGGPRAAVPIRDCAVPAT